MVGRYKVLIGPRPRARGFAAQQTEAAIGAAALNRMLATGRPEICSLPAGHRKQHRAGAFRPLSGECTKATSHTSRTRH
jgi:hypothetical protein